MLLELLRKVFFSFFLFISFFFFIVSGQASESIKHSVGVYVSQSGLKYFKNNLMSLVENNGFQIDRFNYPGTQITMDETTIEDLVDDEEVKATITDIKSQIQRYFSGLGLDKHQFQIDIKNVGFSAKWDKLSLLFYKPELVEDEKPYDVLVYAWVEASNIKIEVDEITARDLMHKYIGDVGIDGLKIEQVNTSEKLRIGFPLKIGKAEDGSFELIASKPVSNMNDVKFSADFDSPLRLPEIKISINGHEVTMNLDEVEGLVREKEPLMLEKIQSSIQDFLENQAPKMITESAGSAIKNGIGEISQMDPPGAPEDRVVPKLFWSLNLEELDFVGDNLHLGLGAVVDDPASVREVNLPAAYTSLKHPNIESSDIENYDISLAINQGLVNRIIQLSAVRGYFKSMEIGDGEFIQIVGQPVLNMKGKGNGKAATLSLEIAYKVEGIQAVAVKNPIHINFDLKLDFPIDPVTKKIRMIATGVDMDSVFVDDKYIRFFKKKVRKAVREQLKEMEPSVKGMEIADEIPVPTDLGGLILDKQKTEINEAGYLMIYTNYSKLMEMK
ncbi:hypothetical protein [Halobacteriovorax sp. HLS]|uniref:hypothetical protein n=1 Tax=Halobacteriovorax sp. HLS TaxID=2234000 RepID=UPI000FD71F0E|nr:hypothetical protein [Halobacteriovorax sp. HLS]